MTAKAVTATVAGDRAGIAPRFRPGALLASRYLVVRLVARGRTGEIYEVEDRELGVRVALKTLPAGDPAVVGTLARINGQPTRLVGVMPEGYGFPMNKGLWLPIPAAELEAAAYSGTKPNAYARLRPGASHAAAETELTALVERARLTQPNPDERDTRSVSVMTFQEESWGVFGDVIFGVLNLLASAILLLAAVNIGNLLLARTNARMKEIGVRVALGAPRFRLLAQTALENVLLCALGGALAIFVAMRALGATNGFMRGLLGDNMPFWWVWSLDGELVLVAAAVLVLTVVIVSVLPALSVSRADPNALNAIADRYLASEGSSSAGPTQ